MERANQLKSPSIMAMLVAIAMSASGCAAIKGIFKAGLWVGVIAVVAVLCIALVAMRAIRR